MQTRNKSYVGGRMPANSGATARSVAANLWNPSAGARIFVYEIWICDTAATAANIGIARTSARGTASTTITPTLDNAIERDTVPPSGFILDVAWSVAPTVTAADLPRWNLPAAIGAGVIMPFPDPITIPPGTGLAIITPVAILLPICDITFCVGD
jgi:hypothetical protein